MHLAPLSRFTSVQMAQNEPKMTENKPKMSQNDQNACKMRVKTRHGHKRGALRVPGRPNLLKRVPGTLFGQIWFAWGFIGLEKGSKCVKCAQRGPQCLKRAKMGQNGSKWFKMGGTLFRANLASQAPLRHPFCPWRVFTHMLHAFWSF